MARIAVVEDHLLVAETLRLALTARGHDVTLVAPADHDALQTTLLGLGPDLVLLDLDLGPFGDSTPIITRLAADHVPVLVVSGTADRERIGLAFEAGAVSFHAKFDGLDELLGKTSRALHPLDPLDVELRRQMMGELLAIRYARDGAHAPFERLTPRERDVLVTLSTGRSVHEIALDLVLSEATVRTHVRGILTKLDAPSQLAAVAMAISSGWLRPATAIG